MNNVNLEKINPILKFFKAPKRAGFALLILNLALLCMVFIGGLTRLTGSGLSIVEWKLITGILPPLNAADWENLFLGYQQSPEFLRIHPDFTVQDFKGIFWLEYFHRLLGRLLGLFLLIPTCLLWSQVKTRKWLVILWILGSAQGVLGWWMVKSGLIHNPWVSPFRLTGHLLLALLVFTISWALLLEQQGVTQSVPSDPSLKKWMRVSGLFILLTLIWGGLVAGTKAGLIYNTFPLMDGAFIPSDFLFLTPVWRNFLENPTTLQWLHRMLALSTVGSLCYIALRWRFLWFLGGAALLQGGLGLWTLLERVPLFPAAFHQLMAFVLVGLWLWVWRKYA